MNSDATDGRFARDPELQRLHEALTQAGDTDEQAAVDSQADERMVDALRSALDAGMLSPAVQRYVTALLLGGEVPTPATREKFVAAASRSLAYRNANRAALPALLAARRSEANIDVSDLANTLQIPEDEVYRMESGDLNVRDLHAERIAEWVRAVHVEPTTAVNALKHALERSTTSGAPRAAGRGGGRQLSDSDQALLNAVSQLLAA